MKTGKSGLSGEYFFELYGGHGVIFSINLLKG
jgi:hypothetical protein